MNWYKQIIAGDWLQIASYIEAYNTLRVFIGGRGPYTYTDVSPYDFDRIRYLIRKKRAGEAKKILDNIKKKTDQTKSVDDWYSKDEQNEMIQDALEQGALNPKQETIQ